MTSSVSSQLYPLTRLLLQLEAFRELPLPSSRPRDSCRWCRLSTIRILSFSFLCCSHPLFFWTLALSWKHPVPSSVMGWRSSSIRGLRKDSGEQSSLSYGMPHTVLKDSQDRYKPSVHTPLLYLEDVGHCPPDTAYCSRGSQARRIVSLCTRLRLFALAPSGFFLGVSCSFPASFY